MRNRFRYRFALAVLVIGIAAPIPAAAVVPFETTSDTWIGNLPRTTLQPINIEMLVTAPATDYPLGSAVVDDVTSGSPVRLGEFTLSPASYHTTYAVWVLEAGLQPGTYTFRTTYVPSAGDWAASFDEVTFTVDKTPTTTSLLTPYQPETNHVIPLSATVSWTGSWTSTGTVSFYRTGVATPVCTTAINVSGVATCNVPALPAGDYVFSATFNGDSRLLTSSQGDQGVTVVPDTVHSGAVGLSLTTFYPVTDSYRDTVAIKGTRNEPLSVAIRIYTPGGSLLRTVGIASGSGAYSYSWNGRNSSGTIYPEGKYKVTQTLKDGANNTQVVTSYVNLSKKKLYTYTKSITKKGTAATAGGHTGTGSVLANTTTGVLLLKPGSAGWAGAGYAFALPTATIYKSIKFRIYGKHARSVPPMYFGVQNFSWCPYVAGSDWDEGCFDHMSILGNTANSLAWYSTNASPTTNRYGLTVRGMASDYFSPCYIYKAEVVVTYQILKY